jgi:hypothetical protein
MQLSKDLALLQFKTTCITLYTLSPHFNETPTWHLVRLIEPITGPLAARTSSDQSLLFILCTKLSYSITDDKTPLPPKLDDPAADEALLYGREIQPRVPSQRELHRLRDHPASVVEGSCRQ